MKKAGILALLAAFSIFCLTGQPSQVTPDKFKVVVNVVNEDNKIDENLMTSYVKRELRKLEDVQIVSEKLEDTAWDILIDIQMLRIGDFNAYANCVMFYEKIPVNRFTSIWQPHYKEFPALIVISGATQICPVDKIEEFAISNVVDFEKHVLELKRKSIKR